MSSVSSLYLLAAIGFPAITAVFFWLLYWELKNALSKSGWTPEKQAKVSRGYWIVILGWASIISIASISGFTGRFELFPLNVAPMLLIPMIGILVITFSKGTLHLLSIVPADRLIRLQVFRVFVEILLWLLFIQNLLPVQMTFEGRNWDVLSGLSAPFAAWLLVNNKKALIIWNILCLLLLVNIVGTALLSMPTPLRVFMNEPSNTLVTAFPFIFLPAFLVPLAYGLSFLSIRQLSNQQATS